MFCSTCLNLIVCCSFFWPDSRLFMSQELRFSFFWYRALFRLSLELRFTKVKKKDIFFSLWIPNETIFQCTSISKKNLLFSTLTVILCEVHFLWACVSFCLTLARYLISFKKVRFLAGRKNVLIWRNLDSMIKLRHRHISTPFLFLWILKILAKETKQ